MIAVIQNLRILTGVSQAFDPPKLQTMHLSVSYFLVILASRRATGRGGPATETLRNRYLLCEAKAAIGLGITYLLVLQRMDRI